MTQSPDHRPHAVNPPSDDSNASLLRRWLLAGAAAGGALAALGAPCIARAQSEVRPRTVSTLSSPSVIDAKKLSLEIFQQEVRR